MKYFKTYIGAWQPSAICWYEDKDGKAFDIRCEDIPKDAVIYDPDTNKELLRGE